MSVIGDALIDDFDKEYFTSAEYFEKQKNYWKSCYERTEYTLTSMTKRYSDCHVKYNNLLSLVHDLFDVCDIVNSRKDLTESQKYELGFSLMCSKLSEIRDEIKKQNECEYKHEV